jgi:hypothetical protein
MTNMTTTAAAFELSAMIAATPVAHDVRPARLSPLAASFVAVGLALWLAVTLAVLTGRCQPPVPMDISGRASAARERASHWR